MLMTVVSAAIAARFAPLVVNISVTGTRKVSTASDAAPDPGDDAGSAPAPDEADAMRDFLRDFQERFGGLPPQLKLPVRGEGSGFIVRADGLISTNTHVVADAAEVLVRRSDRREFCAKVLGSDKLATRGCRSPFPWRWPRGTGRADAAASAASSPKLPAGHLGLSPRPLQPDERRASGITAGLVVEGVSGASAQAGLEIGDLLLAIDGRPVTSADQAVELVARSDKAAALLVQRGCAKPFVALRGA